ncbi:MAG: hypothetical protein EOP51_33765, partial [Sphingobacteriales bacterium]
MRKKALLCLFTATVIALSQGCHKSENKEIEPTTAWLANTTGLKTTAVGDYGIYRMLSSTGQSAEISAFSQANGGTLRLVNYTGTGHQKWRITDKGDGYFTIMCLASGKYLQAYKHENYDVVIQNSPTNADNQLWRIKTVGTKGFSVFSKVNGLATTANGINPVQLKPYNSGNTLQIWGANALPNEGYRDDEVVRFFQRTKGSISFDQVNSIALKWGANNGKSLWIGEDTYTDNNGGWNPTTKDFPCYGGRNIQFFDVRNSALLQPASKSWDPDQTVNMTTTHSPYKYEILASPDPNNHGGTFSWPGVGIEIGNHVYMYVHEGGGSFNKTVMYDFTESTGTNWG